MTSFSLLPNLKKCLFCALCESVFSRALKARRRFYMSRGLSKIQIWTYKHYEQAKYNSRARQQISYMSPYNFMINLNEGATLVSQGGLLMAGIQNLVFSVYLVVAFRKNLDVFKVVMNSALVVYAVVFAVFFFPVGQHCWALGLSGNVFGHVFLISIDVLLLLRVLTLTPNTFVDKVVVGVLFANRLAASMSSVVWLLAFHLTFIGFLFSLKRLRIQI
ncbi:hypothetical protein BC829DRAFT_75875 [Chytridium lagenaria]|nr:hypothetical protein BC829DRAFT_75875 [Chytridium lagenaria]